MQPVGDCGSCGLFQDAHHLEGGREGREGAKEGSIDVVMSSLLSFHCHSLPPSLRHYLEPCTLVSLSSGSFLPSVKFGGNGDHGLGHLRGREGGREGGREEGV